MITMMSILMRIMIQVPHEPVLAPNGVFRYILNHVTVTVTVCLPICHSVLVIP
jgi:hypothetical protein